MLKNVLLKISKIRDKNNVKNFVLKKFRVNKFRVTNFVEKNSC